MIGSKYLTGESPAQELTHPGQASFAIPGAKKICRECWFWSPLRAGDPRAVCGKAASMSPGRRPSRIPRNSVICKYFTETAPEFDAN
jgi:hypothetical protein